MSEPDFPNPTPDPTSEAGAPDQARRLGLALDAIEQALLGLAPNADPDAIARALAEPVRAFDSAARER